MEYKYIKDLLLGNRDVAQNRDIIKSAIDILAEDGWDLLCDRDYIFIRRGIDFVLFDESTVCTNVGNVIAKYSSDNGLTLYNVDDDFIIKLIDSVRGSSPISDLTKLIDNLEVATL